MSRTRFKQMNKVLTRLIAAAIQAGTLCTIVAMGGLISYRKTFEVVILHTDKVLSHRRNAKQQCFHHIRSSNWAHILNCKCFCSYLTFADGALGLLDPYVDLEHAGSLERYIKRTADSALLLSFCIARL